MRARLSGFILASFVLASPALSAADRPPQVHQVGDHWSAWDAPTPPADAQVHVIQTGDTLWDLARRFYNDPYLWPQLWERNRYILDAHWIYPGDPLVLGPSVATPGQLGATDTGAPGAGTGTGPGDDAAAAPMAGVQTRSDAAGPPVPLGAESDIYCSGYIDEDGLEFPYRIIGSEFEALGPDLDGQAADYVSGRYGRVNTARYNLTVGDVIYLDGGRQAGLEPGELFTVVAPKQRVIHPKSREEVGRYYHYTGRVRVLSVQEDTAIAEIIQACDPVLVGAVLQPYEPEPVPLGRKTAIRPINYPTPAEELQGTPSIIFTQDDLVSLGADHLVFIDRGAEQDVTPGDIYTIYRLNRPGLPPMPIGELAILSVRDNTSLAKIIESKTAIFVGDPLELK